MKVTTDENNLRVNPRTTADLNRKNFGEEAHPGFILEDEWIDDDRDSEQAWIDRYNYEASLIIDIINRMKCKTVLEIGSGPGKLSNVIYSNLDDYIVTEYHLVDKKYAKREFEKRNYKGKFFVKDLFNSFDKSELNEKYDLLIANDFLEHIANPSDIVKSCWEMCHTDSVFFVSVPNWRMKHNFIYRGLFDYDNFIHFMELHGFKASMLIDSPLKTQSTPKLTSEISMPDEFINSWNWYFVFRPLPE